MFGFSKLVANEVTQPLWPSSVPRITNCSAMLGRWRMRSEVEWEVVALSGPREIRCGARPVQMQEDLRVVVVREEGQVICGPKFKRELQQIHVLWGHTI